MRLVMRTTLIAMFLSILGVLTLTLFVTYVMPMTQPPNDFGSWPTAKKEAYLYEHHLPSVRGIGLLRFWVHEPAQALPIIAPEAVYSFSLAWVAAFLGGIRRNAR